MYQYNVAIISRIRYIKIPRYNKKKYPDGMGKKTFSKQVQTSPFRRIRIKKQGNYKSSRRKKLWKSKLWQLI
jgi:hypothetical protein